jgi:KDO2-lipid IV(A) lauroyltransferase
MPLRKALWIGRRIGNLASLVNVKRRAIAYANLKASFPEKGPCEIKQILKEHFEHLGMIIVEILRFPFSGKKYLEKYVTFKNTDRIKEAIEKGKGVIPLGAHFGNWEVSGLALGLYGYKLSVFARDQKYTMLNNLLNKYRAMTGCKVIAKGFSVRDILTALKHKEVVGMLSDQDAGPTGVFVDFFGRPASVAPGAVSFARKTGAVLMPTFIRRVGYENHYAEVGEPIKLIDTGDKDKDMRLNLEKITENLESLIRKYPEQWLWSHKRWKSTPKRTVLILSDGKPGHLNQSLAVSSMVKEALAKRLKERGMETDPILKVQTVELKFKSKFRRIFLDIVSIFTGKRSQGCLRGLRFCLEKGSFDQLSNKYADIVVSCGSSTVGANIVMSKENNAKSIVIMKPGLGRTRKFDLVVLPRHDAPLKVQPNVLILEASPNRITKEVIKQAALRMVKEEHVANYRIGLLIGGDTKGVDLTKEIVEKIVNNLLALSEDIDATISVSTSRRTSVEIDSFLKAKLKDHPRCKLLVIASEGNVEGIVSAIFGMSDVVVVSPDSVSMISEAVSSGKYVMVFRWKNKEGAKNKYDRSIRNLEEKGYIRTASPDKIREKIIAIIKTKPKIKKIDDRDRLTEKIKGIL